MIRHIKTEIPNWQQAIVVSPDAGGAKRYVSLVLSLPDLFSPFLRLDVCRVTTIADKLGLDFALIHRKRTNVQNEQSSEERMELLVGNVKGKTAILVDDMIDTGLTITLATKLLKEAGSEKIYVLASHGKSSRLTLCLEVFLSLLKFDARYLCGDGD